jgi:hypothetical protein
MESRTNQVVMRAQREVVGYVESGCAYGSVGNDIDALGFCGTLCPLPSFRPFLAGLGSSVWYTRRLTRAHGLGCMSQARFQFCIGPK